MSIDLTARERQVLRGMASGQSNAQIGASLHLAEDTIKTHARRMFKKLGARDRAHAVCIGIGVGLLELPDEGLVDVDLVERLARVRFVVDDERHTRKGAPADSRYARLYDRVEAALASVPERT